MGIQYLRSIATDKAKLHTVMIIAASIAIVNMLVVSEFSNAGLVPVSLGMITTLSLLGGLILHTAHVLFVGFYASRNVTLAYAVILFACFFVAGSFLDQMVIDIKALSVNRIVLLIVLATQFLQIFFLFNLVLIDSLSSSSSHFRFLAAANAFLFIPMMFSFLIWVLSISSSMNLLGGAESLTVSETFFLSTRFSCFAVAGIDLPEEVNPIIRNIAAIESMFAQLFMVILVGKMLTK